VDEIKFLIANICLQNSKMGVLKIRGFIMFMLFYDIKKKQNAQKSKIVVIGLILKWLPVRFGKS